MKIIVAKEAGFCFGVKRALDMTMDQVASGVKVSTFGEMIHNDQVVSRLCDAGVNAIHQLEAFQSDVLIVRSHGVGEAFYQEAALKHVPLFDGTCPYVKKIHKIVREESQKGYSIVIVGDEKHPEVQGSAGWSKSPVYFANTREAAQQLPQMDKICVVAQTTITQAKWESVLSVIQDKTEDLIAFNTICDATQKRQAAADALSSEVDVMIVVGGKHSSNTVKLYEVCKKNCKNTYHIETSEELKMINLKNCDKIGITAGASTPDWIINEIIFKLEKN